MSKKGNLASSFKYALAGYGKIFKNEPNFKIHLTLAFMALVAALFLGLNLLEWIVLFFTIVFVLTMEMVNTVLEKIVDLASPEISETARIAKDVSAAAVLTSAVLAVIVGVLLFLPRFFNFLK